MTLRVQDLKPGDVVRIELRVVEIDAAGGAAIISPFVHDHHLAAGNAELVVRPRPVRKGDEVQWDNPDGCIVVSTYVAHLAGWIWTMFNGRPEDAVQLFRDDWTHADGSPISWEASE